MPTVPVQSSRSRLSWADVAKGIGILLVVYGHAQRGLVSAHLLAEGAIVLGVDHFIYSFHMPLFFTVAGFFLAPTSGKHDVVGWGVKLRRVWYPYLIWAPTQILLQIFAGAHVNHRVGFDAITRMLYAPPMQFWFLYALLLQQLMFWLAWRLGTGRAAFFLIAVACAWVERSVELGPFVPLHQALSHLPFLAAGVWLGEPRRLASIGQLPMRLVFFVAFVGFSLVGASAAAPDQVWAMHWQPLLTASGVSAALALSLLVHRSRVLAYLGQRSLEIFVAHTIASAATRIVLRSVLHVESAALHLVSGFVVGVAAPLVLVAVCQRLRFPYLFAWPSRATTAASP